MLQPPLDDTDRRLIALLAQDARMPNNQLAERAGVAPSTALTRVRALRERGVIRGFHADVDARCDWSALGRELRGGPAAGTALGDLERQWLRRPGRAPARR
jgi:DNA-binding Lrp family transcriptional regulator